MEGKVLMASAEPFRSEVIIQAYETAWDESTPKRKFTMYHNGVLFHL
jgi:hypothetical protein